MDAAQSVPAKNSELLDEQVMVSTSSPKKSDHPRNNSAFYEKFILEDLESYWDELNVRLSVSRMVSESMIKGMVTAVSEEAAEKVSAKEADIAALKKRLHYCKFGTNTGNRLGSLSLVPNYSEMNIEIEKPVARPRQGFLDASVELGYQEHLCRFRIIVDEQLLLLKEDMVNYLRGSNLQGDIGAGRDAKLLQINGRIDDLKVLLVSSFEQMSEMFGLLKALVFEHQVERELQKEVSSIMIQNYIRGLHDEFEMKLWEHQNFMGTLNKNWEEKVSELTALRDELDAISNCIAASEPGVLSSQSSLEGVEEQNFPKRKDSLSNEKGSLVKENSRDSGEAMLDIPDFSLLKHMSGEEMTAFLKSEWLKLRRQHESALHEKTEELFRLKREFAKDKGSLPFRKERELDFIKAKLPRTISKLDEIILRKENCSSNYNDHDEICRLKDRISSLVHENEHLRGLLADKRKEANHLSSRVSDAVSKMALHSSSEAKLLNRIKKLKGELEDLKIEGCLRNLLDQTILIEIVGNCESYMDDVKIQAEVLQGTHSAAVRDALSTINSIMHEQCAEQALFKEMLVEREKQLSVTNEENQKLKDENEQLASMAGSTSMQQNEQFNLVNQELNILIDKVSKQELLILEFKEESDSMKSNLDEGLQQIHACKQEIDRLTENLTNASNALEEAKEQNALLHATLQEKEKSSPSSITNDKGQVQQLEFILTSMGKLSKAYSDFESRLVGTMRRTEIRLTNINLEFHPLVQQVILLKKKEFWYKQMLEIKCSNLQKAEAEVDVLGDEVDTLLSLLGKIYVALDHYSPVLKHYPGVMEILQLVQKVLKGESI